MNDSFNGNSDKNNLSPPLGGIGFSFKKKLDVFIENKFKYISLIPAMILLILVIGYPLVKLIYLSFTNADSFNIVAGDFSFIGFDNFVTLFKDKIFIKSIFNTFYFTGVSVLLQTVLGLFLASIVYKLGQKEKNLIVTLVLLPTMIADVAVGLVWKSLLDVSTGVFNYFIQLVGFEPVSFLSNQSFALLTIIFIDVWQHTPFMFLFILSGLESLNLSYFEVAKIEGASPRQTLFYIVLPLIRPLIVAALFFSIITATRIFDKVFILTGGGPGSTTETISTYIQRVGFSNLEFGLASAGGVAMMLITFIIGISMLKSMYKGV